MDGNMPLKVSLDRVLASLYARAPHLKAVVAATGGGMSASQLLFRAGSSSTMLQFSVPYARASLQRFVSPAGSSSFAPASSTTLAPSLPKFVSREMAEEMAESAWCQAQQILWDQEKEEDETKGTSHACTMGATLERFHAAVGVGCTAALATDYERRGVNQAFISVCRVVSSSNVESRRCETFHLHLDKSLRRSREEEDRIVSHFVVYLLAKTASVDPEGCESLLASLQGELKGSEDKFQRAEGSTAVDMSVSVDDAIGHLNGDKLSSVSFLPSSEVGGAVTVVEDLPFKGLVLSGSFNPLHQGHVDLALAAKRLLATKYGRQLLPIAFEIAVANADKGSIATCTLMERVGQFTGDIQVPNTTKEKWPVLVTNATLFSHKAELLKDCIFIIGADTAVRLVDKKYYGMDEHKMVLSLRQIAGNGCSFVVAGRFDEKESKRYISADEVLAQKIPAVLADMFVALREEDFRNDLSSTQVRNARVAEVSK